MYYPCSNSKFNKGIFYCGIVTDNPHISGIYPLISYAISIWDVEKVQIKILLKWKKQLKSFVD